MVDVMNAVIDEILKTIQNRLAGVETHVTRTHEEISELRDRLDATRREVSEIKRAQAGIVSRLDRIERRMDATDLPTNDA